MEVRKIEKSKQILDQYDDEMDKVFKPKKWQITRVITALKQFHKDDQKRINSLKSLKITVIKTTSEQTDSFGSQSTMSSLGSILWAHSKKCVVDEDNESVSSDTDSDSGEEIVLFPVSAN